MISIVDIVALSPEKNLRTISRHPGEPASAYLLSVARVKHLLVASNALIEEVTISVTSAFPSFVGNPNLAMLPFGS